MANGWLPCVTTNSVGLFAEPSRVAAGIGQQFVNQSFSEVFDNVGMTYLNYAQGDIYTRQFLALMPKTRQPVLDTITKVDLQPRYDVASILTNRGK